MPQGGQVFLDRTGVDGDDPLAGLERAASSSCCGSAARVAAPSGLSQPRDSRQLRVSSAAMAASLTASAAPPLARTISRHPEVPDAARHVEAGRDRVPGRHRVSAAPDSNARTSGAVASLCTQYMRGRAAPIRPSASSSAHAFHMPSTPVPPPVG